jgi:hypothetical protein
MSPGNPSTRDAASVSRQTTITELPRLDGMSDLNVIAIDPARLESIRHARGDEHGNDLVAHPAEGWEPLRCCLRIARADEQIALISYSPFSVRSPWAEVGPVFIHAEACAGHPSAGELPAELRAGPRILRTYYADESLDYDDITFVRAAEDIEPALHDLLNRPRVAAVHVRAAASQCFLYEVRRAS